jgi:hypothetical protein
MLGVLLLGAGCATTVPKADFSQGMALATHVAGKDEVKARVICAADVSLLDIEKTRIAQRIEERVAAKKIRNPAGAEPRNYDVEVTLTRYEKGNAFARAMLAGLGQIHVDGNVRLYEQPEHKKVGDFLIKKTFAWGGIYGATVSMEDIETTFADGVAAALTGQAEDPPKEKKE